MPYNRATAKKFAKGLSEAWFFSPANGNLDYYTNMLDTAKITSSVNMGAIETGLGNYTAINIPDSAKLNVEMTTKDFALEPRQLSVGGTLAYNGIQPISESKTATGETLTLTNTPCAPYGYGKAICFVDNSGTAYEVDTTTKVVQGFTATAGTTYCIRYFMHNASAQELTIWSDFSPTVEIMYVKTPVYKVPASGAASSSTLDGYEYSWIPRMQFGGDTSNDGSQTNPMSTSLSGSALAYDPSSDEEVCTSDGRNVLGYMVYVPVGDVTVAVEGVVIVGGSGGATLASGSTYVVPAKYIINDQLVPCDLADLTWVSSDVTKATVADGVVTGVAAGDTVITASVTVGTAMYADTLAMTIT